VAHQKKTWLLSYPRSGVSWLRYIAEVLTKTATQDFGQRLPNCGINRLIKNNNDINYSCKPFITKLHDPSRRVKLANQDNGKQRLVLVLRNYKEVIPTYIYSRDRHSCGYREFMQLLSVSVILRELRKYFSNVLCYNGWAGPKHIIYYEELMTHPKRVIKKWGEILKAKDTSVSTFINNYQEHRKLCLKLKTQPGFMSCNTKGAAHKLKFFSDKMTTEQMEEVSFAVSQQVRGALKHVSIYT